MNKSFTSIEARDAIEAVCGSYFFIGGYGQDILDKSPSLRPIPQNREYEIVSIRDLSGGTPIHNYGTLLEMLKDAGHQPCESQRELAAYALANWDKLEKAGFSTLYPSAPAIKVAGWFGLIYAILFKAEPTFCHIDTQDKFDPYGAVLVIK